MSSTIVSKLLTIRLNEAGYEIAPENSPFTPKSNLIYLRESLLADATLHRPVSGGLRNNRTGLYNVTVSAPMDESKFPARNAVEEIENLFFAGYRVKDSGITVSIIESTVGQPFMSDDRFNIPITIRYMATGNEL